MAEDFEASTAQRPEDFKHFRGCPARRPSGDPSLEAYTIPVPPASRVRFGGKDVATILRCVQCAAQIELAGDQVGRLAKVIRSGEIPPAKESAAV